MVGIPSSVVPGTSLGTLAILAVSLSPAAAGAPADEILVEYRMVHEEINGGADSGVSPDGRWISYSHSKSGNREIYAVSTETGEIKNLTNSPGNEWDGHWHPDGSHIVFTAKRNGQQGVFIRNLATGEETTVMSTQEGIEDYPSFSKDGKSISFTAGPKGSREVYRWDWDTGEVKPITQGHNYVGATNFSRDGSQIVYHAYYGGGYKSEKADIFVVDANGGKGENVTRTHDVWVYKAQWAHNDDWIVFSARYDTPNFNLWVMRPDGSERHKITNVEKEDFRWGEWTADGRIAWHGVVSQIGRLSREDTSTGARTEIAASPRHVRSLSASSDRKRIVYEIGGEIFVAGGGANAEPKMIAEGTRPPVGWIRLPRPPPSGTRSGPPRRSSVSPTSTVAGSGSPTFGERSWHSTSSPGGVRPASST